MRLLRERVAALERAHRARRELLNQLTRALTATTDPDEVARQILAALGHLLPGSSAGLWRWVKEEGLFRAVASVGFRDPPGGGRLAFEPGEGLVGAAAATGEPVLVPDLLAD
ncbi:MAG: GAF domain-containing protein, partial [Armatimonadota bacterium]|nr:GAF domain-containing protein [Armatimonadota bacterium]